MPSIVWVIKLTFWMVEMLSPEFSDGLIVFPEAFFEYLSTDSLLRWDRFACNSWRILSNFNYRQHCHQWDWDLILLPRSPLAVIAWYVSLRKKEINHIVFSVHIPYFWSGYIHFTEPSGSTQFVHHLHEPFFFGVLSFDFFGHRESSLLRVQTQRAWNTNRMRNWSWVCQANLLSDIYNREYI